MLGFMLAYQIVGRLQEDGQHLPIRRLGLHRCRLHAAGASTRGFGGCRVYQFSQGEFKSAIIAVRELCSLTFRLGTFSKRDALVANLEAYKPAGLTDGQKYASISMLQLAANARIIIAEFQRMILEGHCMLTSGLSVHVNPARQYATHRCKICMLHYGNSIEITVLLNQRKTWGAVGKDMVKGQVMVGQGEAGQIMGR